GRLRAGLDAQIGPVPGWPQIGNSRAVAPAIAREQLIVADAFLIAAVEVAGVGNAELAGATNDGLHQFVLFLDVGRPQRSAAALRRAGAAAVVLGLDEVRQDAVPVPADIAELRPVIVVGALPANEDQAVDRA